MNVFTLREMLVQGWPVLTILLIMSILSITTIVDRYVALRRARVNAQMYVANVIRMIDNQGVQRAIEYCDRSPRPVARVIAAVLAQRGQRADRERAMQHAIQAQIRELQAYVPILGTVAGSAPFVGLFGTVIGIIRAFADIATNIGGGPEVVASGIAEALITTAGGLLVAIPALIGYNYFVHQIQRLAEEIDLAVFDVIERLSATEA